jgi:N-acetylmuramoyl-L-alanine amidase
MAIVLFPIAVLASQADIDEIRVAKTPERTRVVFVLNQPPNYKIFTLSDPLRMVIDFSSAQLSPEVSNRVYLDALPKAPIRAVWSGERNNGEDVRVVLGLNAEVQAEVFTLKPDHRLVIDLFQKDKPGATVTLKSQETFNKRRDVIVVIDAGHGGDDPGAVGPGNLYEKDVVLEIAKKLFVLFERERGFRPIMIRKGDSTVELSKRSELAEENKADVFLSIHADAFKSSKVSGSSVYALSQRGSDNVVNQHMQRMEANQRDRRGGAGSIGKSEVVPHLDFVITDLKRDGTLRKSYEMGLSVLNNLKKVNKLHKKTVEYMSFSVLRTIESPSLLIETGFISNPAEAKKLTMRSHQAKLAKAIFQGVTESLVPPPDSYLLWVKQGNSEDIATHAIKRGDNLSEIAERYRISVKKLKDFNGLRNDTIQVGQTLKIPPK